VRYYLYKARSKHDPYPDKPPQILYGLQTVFSDNNVFINLLGGYWDMVRTSSPQSCM
jgi:hypothetical protein